jgi:hypothetical protein
MRSKASNPPEQVMNLKFDPTQILTAWTALIAILSLVNKYGLGKLSPNVARFVSALISLPTGHLANFIEDIETLLRDTGVLPPKPPTGGSSTGSPSSIKPPNRPPPPNAARGRIGFGFVGCLALGLSLAQVGCTPAQQAQFDQIEQIVLADLAQGKPRAEILVDVGNALAGKPGADAAIVLVDVLTFLIDAKILPPNVIPLASEYLTQTKPEAAAHRAALKIEAP